MTVVDFPFLDYTKLLQETIVRYGGAVNAHAHLDRAQTMHPAYLEHWGSTPIEAAGAPLRVKQSIVGELHGGLAYDPNNLRARMRLVLERSLECGVRSITSCIDATPDIGMRAIEAALELKNEFAPKGLAIEIVPHPIFGFKEDARFPVSRWELFVDACKMCDGVGALPERDIRHDSVGPTEHLRRTLLLGKELGKPVYVHVGQANDPDQLDIFELLEAVKWLDYVPGPYRAPCVYAIHNISLSAYDEPTFARIVHGLLQYRIGVICCPRAAVSMRQLRSISTPTHNSITRVLDYVWAGVPLRMGTDNIGDLFMPNTTECMIDQVRFLCDVVRQYDPILLAKLAAGMRLNDNDRETAREHLMQDLEECRRKKPDFKPWWEYTV